MNSTAANIVYAKTQTGMAELVNRHLKLPSALRRMLILVDGSATGQQLYETATKMGAPTDAPQQLLALGLIAPVTQLDFIEAANESISALPPGKPTWASVVQPAAQTAAQADTENSADTLDFFAAKRPLVKLIEKHLGPGGERLAIAVEEATTANDFMIAAMKTKGILHNLKPASVNDPFWPTIGL